MIKVGDKAYLMTAKVDPYTIGVHNDYNGLIELGTLAPLSVTVLAVDEKDGGATVKFHDDNSTSDVDLNQLIYGDKMGLVHMIMSLVRTISDM